jgi:hypothetical protein
MPLSSAERAKLRAIMSLAGELLAGHGEKADGKIPPSSPRKRRSGKELAAFRRMLVSERKRGVPVAEIAEKHGISAAYIYQLGKS